jgi:hypothetical protein
VASSVQQSQLPNWRQSIVTTAITARNQRPLSSTISFIGRPAMGTAAGLIIRWGKIWQKFTKKRKKNCKKGKKCNKNEKNYHKNDKMAKKWT